MAAHTIINIGRQFGSGGKAVALSLGRKLGIQVYDSELIAKAVSESGFSKDLFEKHDENRSLFTLSNHIIGYVRFGLNENYINDNELFRLQSEAIRKIAEEGSAIFLGRASDYVLRDMECLDVFITAPLGERKKVVAERLGITEEDAAKVISRKDKGRADYYNYFTFGEWGTAAGYDLCIDSSILGIDGTADFIIEFGRKSGLIL